LIVDALGWRRVLSNEDPIQPPKARLSRGLEVHPPGRGNELELWVDAGYVRAGYSWSFPAGEELRVGVGSFWPHHHVKEPTVRLAGDLELPAVRYQGNWIPHQLRRAVEDGVFFAGDSAGHCLPLTAEGIRTALYFGIACGRELRAVLEGRRTREQALASYGAFSDSHAGKYACLLAVQRAVGQLTPSRGLTAVIRRVENRRLASWIFRHYLAIAPPSFAAAGPRPLSRPRLAAA
jgi:flavin-dependent dehydrogenase